MRRIMGFILHRNFEKSYARLDKEIRKSFKDRRNLLMIDPQHPILCNHALHGKWSGYRSINISGDVRAIYKMEGFIVIFVEIGSHSQLYK